MEKIKRKNYLKKLKNFIKNAKRFFVSNWEIIFLLLCLILSLRPKISLAGKGLLDGIDPDLIGPIQRKNARKKTRTMQDMDDDEAEQNMLRKIKKAKQAREQALSDRKQIVEQELSQKSHAILVTSSAKVILQEVLRIILNESSQKQARLHEINVIECQYRLYKGLIDAFFENAIRFLLVRFIINLFENILHFIFEYLEKKFKNKVSNNEKNKSSNE